jgi:hypothetical protein
MIRPALSTEHSHHQFQRTRLWIAGTLRDSQYGTTNPFYPEGYGTGDLCEVRPVLPIRGGDKEQIRRAASAGSQAESHTACQRIDEGQQAENNLERAGLFAG